MGRRKWKVGSLLQGNFGKYLEGNFGDVREILLEIISQNGAKVLLVSPETLQFCPVLETSMILQNILYHITL